MNFWFSLLTLHLFYVVCSSFPPTSAHYYFSWSQVQLSTCLYRSRIPHAHFWALRNSIKKQAKLLRFSPDPSLETEHESYQTVSIEHISCFLKRARGFTYPCLQHLMSHYQNGDPTQIAQSNYTTFLRIVEGDEIELPISIYCIYIILGYHVPLITTLWSDWEKLGQTHICFMARWGFLPAFAISIPTSI